MTRQRDSRVIEHPDETRRIVQGTAVLELVQPSVVGYLTTGVHGKNVGHRLGSCIEMWDRASILWVVYGVVFFGICVDSAAALVLSEFMADNASSLRDNDGALSDWVEIHNDSDDPVDLEGYYLTDSALDLRKWAFPSLELRERSYLVVFCSGKARSNTAGSLHTHFELDSEGEYLELVHPDGVTVVSEFAPQFPPQLPDASFGYAQDSSETLLVAAVSSEQRGSTESSPTMKKARPRLTLFLAWKRTHNGRSTRRTTSTGH